MKTFTDSTGRTWTLGINVSAIKRVRNLANVDLMQAVEGNLLERLVSDPILLCDVIFSLVEPEAQAANVTDQEFGRAMAGDAIDSATTALLEELVDFFPRDRRRLLAKALEKLRKLTGMAISAVEVRLESGDLEKQMQKALAELSQPEPTPGGSSGTSLASSGSIPAS